MPGETFSLNGTTGHAHRGEGLRRGRHHLGRRAGPRASRGGISQFATTTYNAAYFAGMKDAGHKEHSFYISRYPPGREATVFQNPDGSSVIDLKFTNDMDTGVAIQTIWTPSSITVKLWGTKKYEVESVAGAEDEHRPSRSRGRALRRTATPSNGAPGLHHHRHADHPRDRHRA